MGQGQTVSSGTGHYEGKRRQLLKNQALAGTFFVEGSVEMPRCWDLLAAKATTDLLQPATAHNFIDSVDQNAGT